MGAAAQLQGFVSRRRALFREELAEWVRIPSIAGDPERVEAVHRSAAYLAGRCRDAGFPRGEVWSQGDSAAVFAEWMARPGAPTVQTLEERVRTERAATSVEVIGCRTEEQPQRR